MTQDFRDRARELATVCQARAKELDRLGRALAAVADEAGFRDPARRRKLAKELRDARLLAEVTTDLGELGPALAEAERAWRQELHMGFVDRLLEAAAARGLEPRRLGDRPPVWGLGGLAVELDLDKEQALVSYAREEVARCALDPAAILDAVDEARAGLEAWWPGPERFFDALAAAWGARLGREGRPAGERVALVDLCDELAVELARRGLGPGKDLQPFPRVALAACLDRLAREGALQQGRLRLELGTATGGTTKDKRNVLFLEAGMGGGQYYLSLRFAPADDGRQR
ncbi:MAG: hypothetical protein R3F30_15125 [Planctomycetota bacterium]